MHRYIALTTLLAALACADREALAPPAADEYRAGSGELSALTWNVYYGADLDVLLDESLPLPVRTALVLGQVMATDAPARAAAIARIIATDRPHLVGLQEVARYRFQSPGDFLNAVGELQNPFPNAETEIFDFLELLLTALAAHGAEYFVASRTVTLDAELPVLTQAYTCTPCDDLRFTESVAILARSDVATSNPQQHLFEVNMAVEVAGFTLPIVKGWASVDARVKGRDYRFVTTHLEPADILPGHAIHAGVHQIQLAQARQLLAALDDTEMSVVLTGDLNSEPGTSTDTYDLVLDAGFVDTWLIGSPRGPGHTANQDADLLNVQSNLWHRIDYVLFRDRFTLSGLPFRGAVDAWVVGAQQADRTSGGLWPSDHAGVTAVVRPQQGLPGASIR
jgi:hypothetical protein